MRRLKLMTALLTAGPLLVGAGAALAAQPGYGAQAKARMASANWQPITYSHITGKVTAIATQSPTTLTVQATGEEAGRTIQVQLTGSTGIRQGLFAQRPADIKVGSHVWVDYERVQGQRVADSVRILDPTVPKVREPEGPDVR